jgi:hypothetical protein
VGHFIALPWIWTTASDSSVTVWSDQELQFVFSNGFQKSRMPRVSDHDRRNPVQSHAPFQGHTAGRTANNPLPIAWNHGRCPAHSAQPSPLRHRGTWALTANLRPRSKPSAGGAASWLRCASKLPFLGSAPRAAASAQLPRKPSSTSPSSETAVCQVATPGTRSIAFPVSRVVWRSSTPEPHAWRLTLS